MPRGTAELHAAVNERKVNRRERPRWMEEDRSREGRRKDEERKNNNEQGKERKKSTEVMALGRGPRNSEAARSLRRRVFRATVTRSGQNKDEKKEKERKEKLFPFGE